jgi:hypothetical protein
MVKLAVALLVATIGPGVFANDPGRRTLTFDDRLRAQEAIQRIDDRHPIDVAQMAALEAYWKIVPTDEMLERELRRVAREITPPGRLLDIYAALDNDPFLIKECLARPAFVDRMSRDLFAFDPALHAGARTEAVELRRKLVSGELNPWADYPGRTVFALAQRRTEGVGHTSSIEEERDGFVLSIVLSETTREVRVARYVISKMTFEAWWGMAPSGTTSEPDVFSFCAVNGDVIVLSVHADPAGPPAASPSRAFLLDVAGEPLPAVSETWTAPYTGVYFAEIVRDATPTRDEYLLRIGLSGRTGVEPVADVDVTTTVAPEPVEAGGLLTHAIVMHNSGPESALDAEMLLLLPEATTYESITVPVAAEGLWNCSVPVVGGKGTVSCTSKCFAPGASASFTITVRVDPCVGSTVLTSETTASSVTADSNPANNVTVETTSVIDPGTCDDANICTADDRCGPGIGFRENFDDVPLPVIPSGWTATLITGPEGARAWRTIGLVFDTEPNSVFTADAPDIRDSVLDSPGIPIVSPTARLRFRNRYDLERENDGGVLEIKIGGGSFVDILEAGGGFVEGAYDGTISENFGSPISGRQAWTGLTAGFVPTTVNLPAAAAGQTIVLRWRMATDRGLGRVGQWVDSVSVSDWDVCQPGVQVACDDNDACTADACDAVVGCGHVAISCDDRNSCTDDVCDPILQCVHAENSAACDDQNACTLTDVCAAGACIGSAAVVCHDSDICTADACDPSIRCVATTANFDTGDFSAGRVDGRDLVVFAEAWQSCVGTPHYNAAANLDRQGTCIDMADFHLFMSAFGGTCAR